MKICVYCSSSDKLDPKYFELAQAIGTLIGQNGHDFVFGGGAVGLMGEVAKAAQANGSNITGVIPKKLHQHKICYEGCNELIITENMRDRKQKMEELADAFITLPGGFGTLEEVSEIITGKQLSFHNKPIVILDCDNFYAPLIDFFEIMFKENFSQENCRELYHITSSATNTLKYIEDYKPQDIPSKWIDLK